jgi:hypothetical protein
VTDDQATGPGSPQAALLARIMAALTQADPLHLQGDVIDGPAARALVYDQLATGYQAAPNGQAGGAFEVAVTPLPGGGEITRRGDPGPLNDGEMADEVLRAIGLERLHAVLAGLAGRSQANLAPGDPVLVITRGGAVAAATCTGADSQQATVAVGHIPAAGPQDTAPGSAHRCIHCRQPIEVVEDPVVGNSWVLAGDPLGFFCADSDDADRGHEPEETP